jgi:hypothetical protein
VGSVDRDKETGMAFVDFQPALIQSNELQLTTVGRRTGRESSRQVWFVRDNQTLFLIPGDGADSQWYKNLLQTPRIRLSAQGTEQIAQATPITDSNGVTRIVEAFQDKYGRRQMAALYPKCDVAVEVHALAQ